ncbi:MAG: hypothetical protein M1821_003134 [Bathelium mastoideum]|nr:MAG: hypothetical protein M1821_003134 [Bathelium mastoideum]KAI9688187.1 MAG: hypothetical protein M1822_001693 [Bathelium mastoideum]
MGAGESKQAGAPSQHVFASDQPVRFSSELVNSLQNSPEKLLADLELTNVSPTPQTDSTRGRALELQIQSRVTAELERLASDASSRLASLTEHATSAPSSTPDSSATPAAEQSSGEPSLLDKARSALTGTDSSSSADTAPQSRETVQQAIAALREKLDGRKQVERMDGATERAREELVACLRTNDRRPLDCWREVEGFKREVGRLERAFVEGTLR